MRKKRDFDEFEGYFYPIAWMTFLYLVSKLLNSIIPDGWLCEWIK